MAYQLSNYGGESNAAIDSMLQDKIEKLLGADATRYRRLWAYYRNPMRPCGVSAGDQGSERPYRQAQEWGLPSRITGVRSGLEMFSASPVDGVARKEVVIENDIAWRIDTITDYLFGKPIVINSAAPSTERRAVIEELLRQILAHNGGIVFFQQLALIGSVHGFVDVLVKFDAAVEPVSEKPVSENISSELPASMCGVGELGQPPMESNQSFPGDRLSPEKENGDAPSPHVTAAGSDAGSTPTLSPGATNLSREALSSLARRIRLEMVEPARALPLLSPADYRCVLAYGQVYELEQSAPAPAIRAAQSIVERIRARFGGSNRSTSRGDKAVVVEMITPDKWQRYENVTLVAEGANSLGRVPLVHIQNSSVPFEYSGGSDVEPLIPVQDEINARLSDRAYRITMQAFKMFLAKGVEDFTQMPVAPGRMWLTDNENADIIEFGGDGKTFSEDNHISEMREAMDKISGVTPIAAGALKGRIGRLTSAAALRVTMLALLAKTERKRTAYGPAIEQICQLALEWLDRAGLFPTTPQERMFEIHWPSPLPVNELEELQTAQAKVQVGVPREVVLRELGY